MRKHAFEVGEYYHVYNRGTDKRDIINDIEDLNRFLQGLQEFNYIEPIGSIYENSFRKDKLGSRSTKLVTIVAYCINPNHFHLLLTPRISGGVEKFMQKIGGYTRYYNEKYDRSGVLFQGKFKSIHIKDERYLHHLSAYINMNNRAKPSSPPFKLSASSLEEYVSGKYTLCDPRIVLQDAFSSGKSYLAFAKSSWKDTLERKEMLALIQ